MMLGGGDPLRGKGYPLWEDPGYHGYRDVIMFNVYFWYKYYVPLSHLIFVLVKIKCLISEISLCQLLEP